MLMASGEGTRAGEPPGNADSRVVTDRVVTDRVGTGAVIAVAAGVVAAFGPASPTDRPVVDAMLVAVGTAAVVFAAASAPWWVLTLVAVAALAVAVSPLLMAIAAVAVAVSIWVGMRQRDLPEARAAGAAITFNVLGWAELQGFLGLSATVTIAAGALVFVLGMRRRSRPARRRAWTVVGVTGAGAVLATIGLAAGAASARSGLTDGRQLAEQGISALDRGDFAAAAERFEDASAALGRADDDLRRPWTAAASVVPVVAQHRAAALDLSRAGSAATAQVADALRQIDPDTLQVVDGRIDLDAVRALGAPFAAVDAALDTMAAALDTAESPWLVAPVTDALGTLGDKIDENAPRLDNAVTAVALAPQLLGGEGTRTYLVLFTTPSEARGIGGFPGNYAELTIDDGRIEMSQFGRVRDLEAIDQQIGTRIDGSAGFLARYAGFGYDNDGNGRVGDAAWRNLTVTPNFPWVGDVAGQLYEQETGTELDGLILMDPYVVQALLAYTGPIELTSVDQRLTSDNAAQFLLRDQYQITLDDNDVRIDALEEAGELTFATLLAGNLPEPTTLARDLGPLAADRRLMVWTTDSDEQDLLRRVDLLGEIPPLDGGDGWSLAVSNGGGSKIDSFLERTATYTSSTDPANGQTTATLRVELTNTAPAGGLPDYVIGNTLDLPQGTSRLYTSLYSPLNLLSATVDGEAADFDADVEAGWRVYSRFIEIGPGQTAVVVLQLGGVLQRPDHFVTWEQPMVEPLVVTSTSTDADAATAATAATTATGSGD